LSGPGATRVEVTSVIVSPAKENKMRATGPSIQRLNSVKLCVFKALNLTFYVLHLDLLPTYHRPMTPDDFPIPRSQTGALGLILRAVARGGYAWHSVQTAPEERILVALGKLHEKHRILINRMGRHARREAGLPVAYLVLGPEPREGRWPLVLLSTQRLEGENMHRVTDPHRPLTWPAWRAGEWRPTYVLRRDPDRRKWTWYLGDDFYRELLEEALHWTQKGDWPRVVAHLRMIGTLPLFHGVWEQAHEIRRRVQRLWGDRHLRDPGGQWKAPPWRKVLEEWPGRPFSINVRIWRDEPPRTVGEWLEINKGGSR